MYYVSSNADWSGLRFSFVIYQSTACISGSYQKCIIYHPTSIGATERRTQNLLSMIQRRLERLALFVWSACMYTQNLLSIIQRRSERLAFSLVIYHPTACSGVECTQNVIMYHPTPIGVTYPKFIKYDPTPIGATRAFCVECMHVYPKFIKYYPTPIGATCFFVSYISSNCL
jgi:hypothetical protein